VKVELDFRKSVQENAAAYYDESKKLREKAKGAEKAAVDTEKKLAELEKRIAAEKEKAPAKVRVKREKEWFERFRWFRTSGGRLCIAGRDAKQNEVVVSKYLEEGDLFFHAEIHGAPATVLKGGAEAGEAEKREAAQFAASYSSAWKLGTATVDVYAVKKEQVSKRTEAGESAGKGAFIIRGEREWFKSTPLGLVVGTVGERIGVAPAVSGGKGFGAFVGIRPGEAPKDGAAKSVLRALGGKVSVDEILQALPAGDTAVG